MEELKAVTARLRLWCSGSILNLLFILILQKVSGYPYEIKVSDIKSTSVSLRWKSTEVMVDEFMIECRGSQKYRTHDGEVHNTEMHVRSQYVPKGMSDVIVGGLMPYYNYSCVIGEEVEPGAQVFNGKVSDPVVFCTDVAAPAELPPPKISKEDSITYIWLREVDDNKSGPIKGYSVQFHLISDPVLNDIPFELDLTDPFGKLAPVNIEYAKVSQQPSSFQILFEDKLPKHIHIDHDLLNGALRNGAVYRVIVVPYVESRTSKILFTPSQPSVSFVAVGMDRNAFEPSYIKKAVSPSLSTIIAIVIGILLPLVCLSYICCIGIFVITRDFFNRHDKDSDYYNSCCGRCGASVKRGSRLYMRHLVCCDRCVRHRKDGFELLRVDDDSTAAEDNAEPQASPTLPHRKTASANQPKIKKARLYRIDHLSEKSNSTKGLSKTKHKPANAGSSYTTKAQSRKSEGREAVIDQKPQANRKHHNHKQYTPASSPAQKLAELPPRPPATKGSHVCTSNVCAGTSPKQQSGKLLEPQRGNEYRILKDYRYQHHHHHYSETRPKHKPPPKPSGMYTHQSPFRPQPAVAHTKSHDVCQDRQGHPEHERYSTCSQNRVPSKHASKSPKGVIDVSRSERLWEHNNLSPSESSGSTLVNEEINEHALNYTTSASILDMPCQTDNFFSPCEDESDRQTVELVKGFTRTKDMHHKSPLETPRKTSSERFEFISLSSGTSQTDGKGFGPSLSNLH